MNPTHEIHVCDGRSCRTFGGPDIKARLEEANKSGIFPEGTEIFTSGCLGPCSTAPNIIVDTEFMQNVDPQTVVEDAGKHLHTPHDGHHHTDEKQVSQSVDTPPSKTKIYEDPDMRQPTTRTGLSAEDIMAANNFLGDL